VGRFVGALSAFVFLLGGFGCGKAHQTFDNDADMSGDDAGGDQDLMVDDTGGDGHQCVGLECQQVNCAGDPTSVSGTVFAPNGTLPLYNVIVYVPNAPLMPFASGIICDQCGVITSGAPLVVTLTDSKGHFQLKNVPVGTNIPVVMQIGKWRRKINIANVNQCVDNPIGQKNAGVENVTRLPKNQKEGDIPKIAVTTGAADKLPCLIPKIGIDPIEYAPGPISAQQKPTVAVSFYTGGNAGAPQGSPPAQPFWSDYSQMKNFDVILFSCEGHEPGDANQTGYDAVRKYMEAGGRIFTTDYMYVWYKYSSDTNLNSSPWSWTGGAPPGGTPSTIVDTFPKGKALSEWLFYVGSIDPYKSQIVAMPPVKGQFPADLPYGYTFDNLQGYDMTHGLQWAHSGPRGNPMGSPDHPRIVTMNMPSGQMPAKQCGKGVHLDLHVTQDDIVNSTFPSGCSNKMREPELVTTFFFFDIASCIQDDKADPILPMPK